MQAAPEAMRAMGGGQLPDWLKSIESIVKGINEMLGSYQQISHNTPRPIEPQREPIDFYQARELKKAEMSLRSGANSSNEFKEILQILIKVGDSLDKMGHGEKTIGDALLSLPFTINQGREVLNKLYIVKYGKV